MDGPVDVWNRTESPDKDLSTRGDLVFEKYDILIKRDYLIYCKNLRSTFKK